MRIMNLRLNLNVFLLIALMSCHVNGYDVSIRIYIKRIHATVNPKFINVAIDSGMVKHHWEKFQHNSTRVITLAAGLAPSFMRMGGTGADFLIFQNDKVSTQTANKYYQPVDVKERSKRDVQLNSEPLVNFTMTASFYDQVHKFVSNAKWDLIFDLNSLLRRPDGVWDSTNAIELINYTVQSGYKMGGWELGNEPNSYHHKVGRRVEATQLAKDFLTLHKLLGEYSQFVNTELLGPSVTQLNKKRTDEYFDSFMSSGGGEAVTAATFHQYYEDGAVAKLEDFYNPDILNILQEEIQTGVNLTRAAGSTAKVWLGETSSAWRGGAPGLSDRYVAAFMWLDKLGMSARDGIDAVIRQTFYGGQYSLLDHETCDPNPDYWLTLLYKLLVGTKVLRVTSPDGRGKIRAYAHCTETTKSGYPVGSVTVYVMNLDQSPVTIDLPDFGNNEQLHVYNMLPYGNSILSKFVKLNGEKLEMVDDKTLPNLLRPKKTMSKTSIPAMSYSFIVLPNVNLPSCM